MSKELTIERLRELADADEHDGDWELEVVLNADEILKHALVGMTMKGIPLLVNPMMPEGAFYVHPRTLDPNWVASEPKPEA